MVGDLSQRWRLLGVALAALVALRVWLAWRSRRWSVGERDGQAVIVRRRGRFLELVLARDGHELVQSRQDRRSPLSSGPSYVDGLHVAMLLDPRPRRVLFLGGGACVGPRQFEAAYPDVELDVVELDPLVIAAANRWFGLRITKRLSVHAADARKFVSENAFGPYDLVVLDAYDASGIPATLTTPDFFASVRAALSPGGALVVNVARRPEARGAPLDREDDGAGILLTIREAFADRELALFDVPGDARGEIDNVVVLVAPRVPPREVLSERAARVEVAPFLPEIVRRRRASA